MARIEADREAAANLDSFISGAGLQCQGCGVVLDRKYLLQILRVKREAGESTAKLVQAYAKVLQGVANRLCIECSPLTLRQRCRRCGKESLVGNEAALAAVFAEPGRTSKAKEFDVLEWATNNASAIAIAALGGCAECPKEPAR
ncbi:MAG: hypothetical protein H6716_29685 [Polyangiaceae bacterium]|nr:hypothetical protein [Polyangiaceae bacterium]